MPRRISIPCLTPEEGKESGDTCSSSILTLPAYRYTYLEIVGRGVSGRLAAVRAENHFWESQLARIILA